MIEKLTATVLVDNIPKGSLSGEWGLSVYIEDGTHRILLDTGASPLFATNAQKLNKSIEEVDYAVLSHAHYDHSDGMSTFFGLNKTASFFLRETAAENCFHKKLFVRKYIGIAKNVLSTYADRILYVKGDTPLCRDVYLIPHHTPGLEAIGKRESMYRRTSDGWQCDNFSHEQSLVFDTAKGLVIFNSCSHGGAANIINEVSAVFPDKKVYGLIGGFHLFNKSESEIRELAAKIRATGIGYVCTGHCTERRAYDILKEELDDIVNQLHVGLEMNF